MPLRDDERRACQIVRMTLALADPLLRVAYVGSVIGTMRVEPLARALDVVCARAEQAEPDAMEALVAIVDALSLEAARVAGQRLREEAVGSGLLALDRLVRQPPASIRPSACVKKMLLPDYGRGRPLTLGERKALARCPDRPLLDRLLNASPRDSPPAPQSPRRRGGRASHRSAAAVPPRGAHGDRPLSTLDSLLACADGRSLEPGHAHRDRDADHRPPLASGAWARPCFDPRFAVGPRDLPGAARATTPGATPKK